MKTEWYGTLADKLRLPTGVSVPPWWSVAAYGSESTAADPGIVVPVSEEVLETFEAIRDAEVFVADNVAEYLFAGTAQENWTPADFPCVAPPFETMWVEYRRPSKVVSEVYGEVDAHDTAAKRTGWLLTSHERPDGQAGWVLAGTVLLEWDDASIEAERLGSTVLWTGVHLKLLLRADGSIEAMSPAGAMYPTSMGEEEAQKHVGAFASALAPTIWPVLLALTFANCKNVPRRVVGPPERLTKRDRRKGTPERRSYHVLDIGPMQRVLRTEGGQEEHGTQRALHVCRGHFKTYSKDAPLFGRVVGTWWWAPQRRGSADQGVVDKDYRVLG